MLQHIWKLIWKEKIKGEEITIKTTLEFKKEKKLAYRMKVFFTKQIGYKRKKKSFFEIRNKDTAKEIKQINLFISEYKLSLDTGLQWGNILKVMKEEYFNLKC